MSMGYLGRISTHCGISKFFFNVGMFPPKFLGLIGSADRKTVVRLPLHRTMPVRWEQRASGLARRSRAS